MPGRERQVPRLAWTAFALTTAMVVAIAVLCVAPLLLAFTGLSGVAGEVSELSLVLGFFAFALAAILSMASLVVRFRRSAGVERQQLKWMAALRAEATR